MRAMRDKQERAKLKMDQVSEKAEILRMKLCHLEDPKEMYDSEV